MRIRRPGKREKEICVLIGLSLLFALRAIGQQAIPVPLPAPTISPSAGRSIDLLAMLDTQMADLIAMVRSSVVSVEGDVAIPINSPLGRPPASPLFRPSPSSITPFGVPGSHSKSGPSPVSGAGEMHIAIIGSGFLLPGGVVVTTTEVAASLQNPRIRLADGRVFPASGITCSARSNVAILHVADLDAGLGLHWGQSSLVRAGNLALTLGNQDGFADTAALGMISSTERRARAAGNGRRYARLIQFQGAPGAGGCGSPLLNTRGEVIGIVIGTVNGFRRRPSMSDAALPASHDAHPAGTLPPATSALPESSPRVMIIGGGGMGLALPSDLVRAEVEALLHGERALPAAGWLGVYPGPQTTIGLQIDAVTVGSPADLAGVRPGDFLTVIDGRPIRTLDLQRLVSEMVEGQRITLDLRRGARTLHLSLMILPRPASDVIEKMPRRSLPH